jgi:hypothetical protein
VKLASLVAGWLGAVAAAGCGGAPAGTPMDPMITTAPDDFVLRDVRKDAARYLSCQALNIRLEMGPWAGSEGNVTALGCGFQVNYYLRCLTNHQCSFRVTD